MSILQVAKYAGVSTATVSRVLNGVPVVSESTKQQVRAALQAIKYDPSDVRRGPKPGNRRGKSTEQIKAIAVMSVGVDGQKMRHSIPGAVVEAITRSAKQSGVRVLLDEMPDFAELSPIILRHEVQGAVVFLSDDAPMDVLGRLQRYVPVVWAMGGLAGPVPVDHVSENNIAVGYLAHQYLYDKGCRDMAFLTLVPQKRNARQRGQAFAGAAAEAGHRTRAFALSDDPCVSGLYSNDVVARPSLTELVAAFAALSPRPSGLFVDRDSTTARLYPLLARHGIQPGRDLTIVSCDNDELALASVSPRPATIDLGAEELGFRIVRRLLLRISHAHEPPVLVQTMPRLLAGEDVVLSGIGRVS